MRAIRYGLLTILAAGVFAVLFMDGACMEAWVLDHVGRPVLGWFQATEARAEVRGGPLQIRGIEDPDARDLGFRAVLTCDHRTGLGTLCHYLVRHEGGKVKRAWGPVCVEHPCRTVEPPPDQDEGDL